MFSTFEMIPESRLLTILVAQSGQERQPWPAQLTPGEQPEKGVIVPVDNFLSGQDVDDGVRPAT